MKLLINKDLLIRAVNLVAKTADKNNHRLPILANLKLVLEPHELTIVASDLEVELTTKVALPQGACVEAGMITVPAEKFFVVCKALSDDQVSLQVEAEQCVITSGKGRYTLKTLPAKDFPSLGSPHIEASLKVGRNTLFEVIRHIRFAVATQDIRHYLTGMLFEMDGEMMTAVATDGHRLAVAHSQLDEPCQARRAIVPGKAVGELERLLSELIRTDEQDTQVVADLGEDFLQLSLKFAQEGEYAGMQVLLLARLIEGKFPDYRRVLPQHSTRELTFDKDAMIDVLRRVSVMSSKEAPGVTLHLQNQDSIKVAASHKEDGGEEFLAVKYQGEPAELTFNEAYLRATLRVLEGEICMKMTEPTLPALIYQVGE